MKVLSESKASKRDQAALLLASGRSTAQTAAGVEVSRRTILRWLKDLDFAARVIGLRRELFKRSGGMLARCTTHAASRLGRLLESDDERVALSAARSVLGLGKTIQDAVEFEQRLAAIEHQLRSTAVNP
jgi:hypothetical protein